jgi:predicted alpha-1,6-mannanase (GH76 family)
MIEAAANAIMQFYNGEGLWSTTGWWNSANCLTALIDYMKLTNDRTYIYAIDSTFEKNKNKEYGNFCNEYVDDTGWWGLAWVDAFDITGNQKYLQMAQIDADFMYEYRDDVCGGGLYWKTDRQSKNAIQNELFIKLAAILHNRIPGDTKYLNRAREVWNWFSSTGVINSDNLVNDGINTRGDCRNNGDVTWTYNQGVIIGGLVELSKATGDANYINRARQIADAVIASNYLSPNGILREPCEGGDCGGDGPSFKGAFIRNLGELNRALSNRPYSNYIQNNVRAIYENRNSLDQYGLHYAGPFDKADAARQHSALEAMSAAL